MKIIPYHPEHLRDCIRVFQSNVPHYFHSEELDEYIEFMKNNEFPHWVIQRDGAVIGAGGIYESTENFKRSEFDNEVGFAWGMVHRYFHKHGYGKALAEHRINYLLANYENQPIVLRTTQNTDKFFQQFGFEEYKRIKNGFGKGMDKVIMVYKSSPEKKN